MILYSCFTADKGNGIEKRGKLKGSEGFVMLMVLKV